MVINDNPTLQSTTETLYQINMDEQLHETCDRFIQAEARENDYKKKITELTAEIAHLKSQDHSDQ